MISSFVPSKITAWNIVATYTTLLRTGHDSIGSVDEIDEAGRADEADDNATPAKGAGSAESDENAKDAERTWAKRTRLRSLRKRFTCTRRTRRATTLHQRKAARALKVTKMPRLLGGVDEVGKVSER